jgi:hypothetical protein
LGEALAGKDDQADAIVLPSFYEFLDDPFGCLQAVLGLEILGGHTARDVQYQHDVNPFALDDFLCLAGLRTGQGKDQQGDSGQAKDHQDMAPAQARRTGQPGYQVQAGEAQRPPPG